MLHALIHGKLDESVPEPSRLEDALTSTILGTLVLVDRPDVLYAWLDQSLGAPGVPQLHSTAALEHWFWPRLPYAEPDCVIRIGSVLFVIEAKYRSSKGGASATDCVPTSDQLFRQFRSIQRVGETQQGAPLSLIAGVSECSCRFVYLVDARKLASARRELRTSAMLMPGATLTLVTWQSLYSLLSQSESTPHWRLPLLRYMERCGLDTFCGFTALPRYATTSTHCLTRWCGSGSGGLRHRLVAAFRPLSDEPPVVCATVLQSWGYRVTGSGRSPGTMCAAVSGTRARSSLLTNWQSGGTHTRYSAGAMGAALKSTLPHPGAMRESVVSGFSMPTKED